MRTLPATVITLACTLAPAAAQNKAVVVDCHDAVAKVEASFAAAKMETKEPTLSAIVGMLREWRQRAEAAQANEPTAARQRATLMQEAKAQQVLLVSGDAEFVDLVEKAIRLLASDDSAQRVQCTVVSLPAATAREQGLQNGDVRAVGEADVGKLLKAAVAAKGKLVNLPEAKGAPLVRFAAEPARTGDDDGKAVGPRVDCRVLPLSSTEALIEVAYGKSATQVRLAIGAGALFRVRTADAEAEATVLWVRYGGPAPAAPTVPRIEEPDGKRTGNGR